MEAPQPQTPNSNPNHKAADLHRRSRPPTTRRQPLCPQPAGDGGDRGRREEIAKGAIVNLLFFSCAFLGDQWVSNIQPVDEEKISYKKRVKYIVLTQTCTHIEYADGQLQHDRGDWSSHA
jgi:hypothetical protein